MPDSESIQKTTLENGLTVVTEHLPSVRTACLGIWILSGSRRESSVQEGMAHFWEHMAFKGSRTRSAGDIAVALDGLGGLSNAFTGREATCYHVRAAEKHLSRAFDILSDIVVNPLLDPEETAREKEVILQEIRMVEETPEEKLCEAFWEHSWSARSLAHAIMGSPETVKAFEPDSLNAWRNRNYAPANTLVTAAGAVDHQALADMAARAWADCTADGAPRPPEPAEYTPADLTVPRDAEQNHVVVSLPSVGNRDSKRFTHTLLATLLGGNMSSRLFQEVREKRGLAYAVYAHVNALSDLGVIQIHAAVDPERTGELLRVIEAELADIAAGGVTREELEHTREHLRGLLYLGSESTENRMMRLARNHILFGRHVPLEETVAELDRVGLEELHQAAAEIFNPEYRGLGLLGPSIDQDWRSIIIP